MKFLKAVLIILMLQLSIVNVSAQVNKFKSTSYSILRKNQNNQWGEWSEPKNEIVMITLDTKKNRVVVNSQEIQLYNIVEYGEKVITKTDETLPLSCVDNEGTPCSVLIVTRKSQGNRKQVYINFAKTKIVYNVEIVK